MLFIQLAGFISSGKGRRRLLVCPVLLRVYLLSCKFLGTPQIEAQRPIGIT